MSERKDRYYSDTYIGETFKKKVWQMSHWLWPPPSPWPMLWADCQVRNAPTSHSVCSNTSNRVLHVSDFILHEDGDDPSPPASVTGALGVSECEPPCTGSGLTFWLHTVSLTCHSGPSVRRLRLWLDPVTYLTCRRRFVEYRCWIVRYRLIFVDITRLDQTQVCWIQTLNCWI